MDAITTLPVMSPAAAEIFLAAAAMALLMFGVFKGGKAQEATSWLAVAVMVIAGGLVVTYGGDTTPAFFGMFSSGPFAQFAKLLILAGSILAIIMSRSTFRRDSFERFEYPVLIVLSTVGMLMMVSANDMIALYVGLETQSLALYVIASIRRDTLRSTEAGLKYFVLGALSSGMLLYGSSMVYGFAGTTEFDALARVFTGLAGTEPSVGLIVGLVFVICGLAFKVSAVPFHMWTPDVYEGAPTPVTALFAVAPKVAALALFLRVLLEPFGALVGEWQQIISLIAVLSMALGAVGALVQTNIKRLMAYSSIGHMGYALVGLAAANEAGVAGILVYLAIYLFMNVGTFACILAMRRQGRAVEGINDLAGLSKTHPGMAAMILIFMFSMAGIPPLAGFFGKWFVFMAAVESGLITLAVLGVLASVIGAFYYLRIVKIMYFDEAEEPLDSAVPGDLKIVMTVMAAVTLLFFIVPAPLVSSAKAAASALFAG
ncbi:MAG: NADH-quinone oxidoreductase subunit NuoN [Nisaea sp.]|uniref:NADH-quinone oxidoreductase subunit NuoN n=1 Tax=Nisaea sp. TaxID=2024842 RepID=UPI001B12CF5E|nr:NADH-quinone oxidoreductase subunit NuoN [Nisaea sp.]MBO6559087.1 NADH-quinone oxidoreductase subunit NuoN [Nisaea sp.]